MRLSSLACLVAMMACSSFETSTEAPQGDGGVPPSLDAGDATPQLDAALVDASSEGLDAGTDNAYVQAVLADDPIGYFRLDEKTGATTAKSEFPNSDGTIDGLPIMGAPGAIANSANTAFQFKGTGNDGISCGPRYYFAQKSPFSLEAWVKILKVDGTRRYLFMKDGSYAGLREQYGVYVHDSDGFVFERHVAGVPLAVVAPIGAKGGTTAVRLDTWHHIVVVYDASYLNLYVDGNFVGSESDQRLHSGTNNPDFQIGRKAFGENGFQGVVDEVAVYNSALSAARISAHNKIGRGL